MEGNDRSQKTESLVGTPESARSIISWQHERYHHLQSLASGLLGSILTALAITATILTALDYQIPSRPQRAEVYIQAADAFSLPVTGTAAESVVTLNYFISMLTIIAAGYILLSASHKLYSIISDRPLEMGASSQNRIFTASTSVFEILTSNEAFEPMYYEYETVINSNQQKISKTHEKFTQAAVRTLGSLILAGLSVYVYYRCLVPDVQSLVLFNISILLPSIIPSFILRRLVGVRREDLNEEETGIFQELFFDNDSQSRWESLQESWIEIALISSVQFLSLISVVIVILFSLTGYLS